MATLNCRNDGGRDKLVGTWKLLSASLSSAGSERNDAPFGLSPTGFLTYTQEGRMSAMMSYSGRKPLSVIDLSLASVEEKAEAFTTFLAYSGRYTLMEDTVIHHVEISSIQNWTDTDLVRLIKFQGDRIILATFRCKSEQLLAVIHRLQVAYWVLQRCFSG